MTLVQTIKILRRFNIFLSVVVVILASYITLLPFFPEISFAFSTNEFGGYAFMSPSAQQALGDIANTLPQIPSENTLVIPSIKVNAQIHEGEDKSVLERGMWRRPNTSNPIQGGNTVIAAHRFLYTTGSNTFYHLDKMKEDDEVLVYWEGKEYKYKVFEITEVPPTAVEIEDNTDQNIITLYTCTPLWTAHNRLVVKAILQEEV